MKEKKAATDAPIGRSLAEARRPTRPTMTFLVSWTRQWLEKERSIGDDVALLEL